MIALLQRVSRASVSVEKQCIASIKQGLLVFIGVEKQDNAEKIDKLVYKLLNFRVFADSDDKMNLSVLAVKGQVLLVPQFTLAADTAKGLRPGFSSAASPEKGLELFTQVVDIMSQQLAQAGEEITGGVSLESRLQTGQFGADMAVELVNDGPVTFHLRV